MRFDWWTLALQAVNFAILVWLLQRFLYRPILRLVDARRAEIDKQFQDARDAAAKATALQAKGEADRAAIAEERLALLDAAEKEAEEAAQVRHARAEQEAAELLEGTRKQLSREREEALGAARAAAVDLGIEMARRLLGQLPATAQAEAWLDEIERRLAAMSPAEIERLVCHYGTREAAITVVSASPFPEDVAARWRRVLVAKFGDGMAIGFQCDPALIAGVNLLLPNAVLSLSWQGALASLRTEIMAHANAR